MRKTISLFLLLALTVCAFAGCSNQDTARKIEYTPSDYALTYSVDQRYFAPGDEVRLTVTAKKVGDKTTSEQLFRSGRLVKGNTSDGTPYAIDAASSEPCAAIAVGAGFEQGDTLSCTYVFRTDADAKQGFYSFCVNFCGEHFEFIGAICLCTVTEEEKAVLSSSTEALLKKYPHLDPRDFKVKVIKSDEGELNVNFTLAICGYRTHEVYRVFSDQRIEVSHEGEYLKYLGSATEPLVRDAALRLTAELSSYEAHSRFYLCIDSEGYLCLCAEILDFDPNLFDLFNGEEAYLENIRFARICQAEGQ